MSSSLRKAQVRAALFRKLEPVRVGRFILLEPLGAGAMGEIYAAYDEQLDRRVALKLVRHGSALTVKADELLLREAQTLAQVSHPNVVQIYEAGTHNGRLFIAMELVRGQTLSSWLGEVARLPRTLRRREILRQFIAAGRGLEAAHTAGVAHRDFKPDNVIVGDDGRVRVVDFGLARALGEEPDPGTSQGTSDRPPTRYADFAHGQTLRMERTGRAGSGAAAPFATDAVTLAHTPRARSADATDAGSQTRASGRAAPSEASAPKLKAALRLTETGAVMGTPRFMAPEQIRGAVADHRSDQFSFCVALYSALYGAFPFAGESLQELHSSMETGAIDPEHSAGVAVGVRRALRRGLSLDPSRRFASMGELLEALEPSVRRRRGWVLGAVLLFLAVGVGVGFFRAPAAEDSCAAAGAGIAPSWSGERQVALHAAFLRSDLPYAEQAWRGLKSRLDRYTSRWRGEAISACRATFVVHTQSEQQLDRRNLCLERGRRQVAALVSELGTGAPDAVQHAVGAAEALPDLSACSRSENLLFGVEPPLASRAKDVAAVRDQLARARAAELLGNTEGSLMIAREASAIADRLKYAPVHAEALVQVARALDGRGTADARGESERMYFDALDIAEAERHDELAAEIWNRLVLLALRLDSGTQQAHSWWRRYSAAVRRTGDNAYLQAGVHHKLGEIYYRDSKFAEAADELNRALAAISQLPDRQLELSLYYDALAKSLQDLDRVDESIALHQRALTIATELLGGTHPDVIKLQLNHGKALAKRGSFEQARSVLSAALAGMSATYRDSHPDAGKLHGLLSDLSYQEGRLDDAAAHARASLQIYERAGAPAKVRAEAYSNLANVEMKRRQFVAALEIYKKALALRRKHLTAEHYQTAVNEGSIAEALVELGRFAEAMPHLLEAERIFEHSSARDRAVQAWVLLVRGEILLGQRELSAATAALEQALQRFGEPADPGNQGLAMWALARALHAQGMDPARVRQLAERARALFAMQGDPELHNHDMVARFLARLPR